jgi:protein SCO1/2
MAFVKPASPLKLLAVLVILFLPAISYYIISKGKNNYRRLEIFGPKVVAPAKEVNGKMVADTIYHTVPPFQFTDQSGNVFSDKMLDGKTYIAEFFFTSCKTICPRMNRELESVQFKFRDDSTVKILSFTVDPENDSVPVLAAYAEKYHADRDKWYFLTGEKQKIYDLARTGFYLAAVQNSKSAEEFNHSEQLVMVDKDRRIRGYYEGTDDMEVSRLMDEIQVLQWEYKQK